MIGAPVAQLDRAPDFECLRKGLREGSFVCVSPFLACTYGTCLDVSICLNLPVFGCVMDTIWTPRQGHHAKEPLSPRGHLWWNPAG